MASSQAPARHQPLTAAIVGLGSDQSSMVRSTSSARTSCQRSALSMCCSTSSAMSYPAEKARPAPVRTTTFTSSSSAASRHDSRRRRTTSPLIAFSLLGRFSVTQAAGPRRSYRTTSLTNAPSHEALASSFYDDERVDGNRAVRAQDQRIHVDRGYPRMVDGEAAEGDERGGERLLRGRTCLEPGRLRDELPRLLMADRRERDRGQRKCLDRTATEADREHGSEVGVARHPAEGLSAAIGLARDEDPAAQALRCAADSVLVSEADYDPVRGRLVRGPVDLHDDGEAKLRCGVGRLLRRRRPPARRERDAVALQHERRFILRQGAFQEQI